MANTLKFGNGNWATKEGSTLAYNDENNNFKPLPFSFERDSRATVVNKDGLIEVVGAGMPRIDYKDNTEGALLLEPSRTNSLLQSNQFDTAWALSSSIALTSGQSGVGGSKDAWLLKKTDASSRYITQSITLSSSTYSYSVFAKKESGNWLYVRLADSGGSLASTSYFDLENGVVGSTSADSLSIHSYNNGWYRCEVKFTHSIGNVRMYPAVGDGSPSGGSGVEGIYIQNAQVEAGSYATSYIPTSGSAVTRLADSCSQTVPDGVVGQTEGVLYAEIKANETSDVSGRRTISLSDETNSNRIYISFDDEYNKLNILIIVGGTTVTASNVDISNQNTYNKVAVRYNSGDSAIYVNGVLKNSFNDTFSSGVFNALKFQNRGSGEVFNGNVKDLRVYNNALTDQELIALTQV